MSCLTPCLICSQKFVSSASLIKHSLQKHEKAISLTCRFYDEHSKEVDLPVPKELDPRSSAYNNYLPWLACVAERINGSHHPKCEGRWFRVDVFQAPQEFVSHMLWKLDAQIHSVRKMRHFKQPMMAGQSIRFAYRFFDAERIKDFLQEQNEIPVKMNAAFDQNDQLVVLDYYNQDDPIEALEAAKRRGRQQPNTRPNVPKVRSSITIEERQGRSTREFEIQWWPKLYKTNFGKLSFRFFVSKIRL